MDIENGKKMENTFADVNTERTGLETVSGVVERVVYSNEENGYTVCEIASVGSEGEDILVTLVGIMPFIAVSETVKACGKWVVHPSFGKQF